LAIVIFGAYITFNSLHVVSFALSLFITIVVVVLSLFMILALDAFSINRQRLLEAQKQTKLLAKIYSKHTK